MKKENEKNPKMICKTNEKAKVSGKVKNTEVLKRLALYKTNQEYIEELIEMLNGVDIHAMYVYLYSENVAKKAKYKTVAIASMQKFLDCKHRLDEINEELYMMGKDPLDLKLFY